MGNTSNLNIPLLAQNQAQKEVTVNEALSRIDAILNRGAIHNGTNTPPASAEEGDLYIIGTAPAGAWAGKATKIAYYNGTWKFITPNEGLTLWVNDEDVQYSWNGSTWVVTNGVLETVTTANSGSTYTIDVESSNIFKITITGNCVFTFANPPVSSKGRRFTLIRKQDGIGGRIITWPTAVKWSEGIVPTLTMAANSVDILTFLTIDSGATWYGRVDGLDVR